MKFTIPPHSVFGMLLRSPWWVSIMLGIALAALLGALFPREYAPLAVVATFPVFIVGIVAAWRQFRTPNADKREAVLADAQRWNWDEFSRRVQDSWRLHGVHASAAEHAGADWRVAQDGRYTLVYARRWKASVHGLEPLRQLAQAMEASGVSQGLYIAAGGALSPPAQRFAREHHIRIWLGDSLSLFLLGKAPAP